MRSLLLTALTLIVTTTLGAQSAAPAGETGESPWDAEAALLASMLRRATAPENQAEGSASLLRQALRFGALGYRLNGFRWVEHDGKQQFLAIATRMYGRVDMNSDWVCYFEPTGDARHAFCLNSERRCLVARPLRHDESLQPEAAMGSGSAGTFSDFLTSPGKGKDGRMWTTLEMAKTARLSIRVIDEHGNPRAGQIVALLHDAAGSALVQVDRRLGSDPIDHPLPLGLTEANDKGIATLAGPPARGAIACIGMGNLLFLTIPATSTQLEGNELTLTVHTAALATAMAARNELAAIATLKNICSAQAQCQAGGVIDSNSNGAGEYGYFGELSGSKPVRNDGNGGVGEQHIAPPVLSAVFGRIENGIVTRSGYHFMMLLPDATNAPVAENESGGGAGCKVASTRSEVIFCCYAWPVEAGVSGGRAFCINQQGDVLACDNADRRYNGSNKRPDGLAAFVKGDDKLAGSVAANTEGQDGQRWTVVN